MPLPMKTPKKDGMTKAPKEAMADDQPRTAGARLLSKRTPIWRKVEPLPMPVQKKRRRLQMRKGAKRAVLLRCALRASMQSEGRRVSASAVCPGYVSETGMFARKVTTHGSEAPGIMGTSPPDAVAKAVLKAVQNDAAEVVVNPRPVRPMVAFALLFPQAGEWLARKIGISGVSQRILDHDGS